MGASRQFWTVVIHVGITATRGSWGIDLCARVRVRPGQTAAHLLLDLDECFMNGSVAAALSFRLSYQLGLQAALLSQVISDHPQGLFDATC